MPRKTYASTTANVLTIFRFLRHAELEDRGHLPVSTIAKETGLHKWTVSRTVDLWMHPFLDIVSPAELEQVGLKIKLVKLKPGVTEDVIRRGLTVKVK